MSKNNTLQEILVGLNFNQKETDAFIKILEIAKQSIKDDSINLQQEFSGIIDGVFSDEIQKN